MATGKSGYLLGILLILLLVLMFGCAGGISKQTRSQITYSGSFSSLQKNPDDHIGEVLLLGGKIIETEVNPTTSEITVLQLPLGRRDRPQDVDRSEGRFLLQSKKLLDPAVYSKGISLTVVGKLIDSEVRAIGDSKYTYPIVEPIEIKLWRGKNHEGPSIHFGIGILKTF